MDYINFIMWKKIKKCNFLVYTVYYAFLIDILRNSLVLFKIEFMDWFYYFSINFIYITALIGFLQLFSKIKRRGIKVFVAIILVIASLIFFAIETLFYYPAYVVNMNGKKMEAILFHEKAPYVEYYEYINPFMRGTRCEYKKGFEFGTKNPFLYNTEYRQSVKFSLTHSATNIIIPVINTIVGSILEPLL